MEPRQTSLLGSVATSAVGQGLEGMLTKQLAAD